MPHDPVADDIRGPVRPFILCAWLGRSIMAASLKFMFMHKFVTLNIKARKARFAAPSL